MKDRKSAASPFASIIPKEALRDIELGALKAGFLDLDEVALQLDALIAQLELNEKEDRLRRYQIAIARERAGDF